MFAGIDTHNDSLVLESRASAQRVILRLEEGESFAALAAELSLDRSTRHSGGKLGLVTSDQLEPTYAEASFAADAGSVFGPVKT